MSNSIKLEIGWLSGFVTGMAIAGIIATTRAAQYFKAKHQEAVEAIDEVLETQDEMLTQLEAAYAQQTQGEQYIAFVPHSHHPEVDDDEQGD